MHHRNAVAAVLQVEEPLRGEVAHLVTVSHHLVTDAPLRNAVGNLRGVDDQLMPVRDIPFIPPRLIQNIIYIVLPYGIRAGAVHRYLAWAVPVAVTVDHQRVLRHIRIGVGVFVRVYLPADG